MKSSNKKTARKINEMEQAIVVGMVANEISQEAGKVVTEKLAKKSLDQQVERGEGEIESEAVATEQDGLQSLDIEVAYQAFEPEALDIELTQNKDDKGGAVVDKEDGAAWWLGGLGILGGIAALAGGGGGSSAPAGDTVAPTVTNFNPADDANAVGVSSNIVVTFNEAIQRGTGNIVLKDASNNVIATYDAATSSNISISGSVLTINPTDDLSSTTQYFVTFAAGSIKDLAGNSYAGTATYDFTTGDAGVPFVETFSPDDGDGSVATTANIIVTFNENVQFGSSGTIQLRRGGASGDLVQTFDVADLPDGVSISQDTLTIEPSSDFDYDTTYYVVFSAGAITDTSGNPFEGTATYDFRTDAPPSIEFRHADFNRQYLGGGSHNGGRGIRLDDRLEIDTTDKAVVEVNLVSSEHINDSTELGADYENVEVDEFYNDVPYETKLQQVIDFDDVENMETFRLNVSEGDRVRLSIELRDLDSDEDFKRVEVNVDESSELYAFDDVIRTHNFGTEVELTVNDGSLVSADYHVVHVSSEAVVSIEANSSSEIYGGENIVVVNENGVNGGGDDARINIESLNNSRVHVSQSDDSTSLDAYASIDAEVVLINGLNAQVEILASEDSKISADGYMAQDLEDGSSADGHAYIVDINQVLGDVRVPDPSSDHNLDVDVSVSAQNGSRVWAWVSADVSDVMSFGTLDAGDNDVDDLDSLALNSAIVSLDTYAGQIDGGALVVSLDAVGSSDIGALNAVNIDVDVYGYGFDSFDVNSYDASLTLNDIETYASGVGVFLGDVSGSLDQVQVTVSADSAAAVDIANRVDIRIDMDSIDVGSFDNSGFGDDGISVTNISMDANVARVWVGYSSDLDIGSVDMLVVATDSSEITADNSLRIDLAQDGSMGSSEIDNVDLQASIVDMQLSADSVNIDQVSLGVSAENSSIIARNSVEITVSTNEAFPYSGDSLVDITNLSIDAAIIRLSDEQSSSNFGEINLVVGNSSDGYSQIGSVNTLALDVNQGYGLSQPENDLLEISNIDMTADVIRVDLDDGPRTRTPSDSSADVNELNIYLGKSGTVLAAGNVINAGDTSYDISGDIFFGGLLGSGSSDNQIFIGEVDASIDANMSASIVSVSVDAESVNICTDIITNIGGYCSDMSFTTAVNSILMDVVSDFDPSLHDSQEVNIDFNVDANVVDLNNLSVLYSDDGTLQSNNTINYGQTFGLTYALNAISLDLYSDWDEAANYDVTVDAEASLIEVTGANPDVNAYSFAALNLVGNQVSVYAESDVSYDLTDGNDVKLSLEASMISIETLGEGGFADAQVSSWIGSVVTSNEVNLELYTDTSLDTDVSLSSHVISLDANDALEVSAGVSSMWTSNDGGPFGGGVASYNAVDAYQNGPWVENSIEVDQFGINVSADRVDAINMTNAVYGLSSMEIFGPSADLTSLELGGVVAAYDGAVEIAAFISNEIYAEDANSSIDVDSTLVNLSVDARVISLDVTSIYGSNIGNFVGIHESIDVLDTLSSDIDVDATLVCVDVNFGAADSADLDGSGDLRGVLSIDIRADESSEITSSVDIRASYDAGNDVSIDIDVENIGVCLDLDNTSSADLALDAHYVSVEFTVDEDSTIALVTAVSVDAISRSEDLRVRSDLVTKLVSIDNDIESSELTVCIDVDDYSSIDVIGAFNASLDADVDLDLGLIMKSILVDVTQDDQNAEHFEVNIFADDSSEIHVLASSELNASASEDASVEIDHEVALVSADNYNNGNYTEVEVEVDDSSDITVETSSKAEVHANDSVDFDYHAEAYGVKLADVGNSESIDIEISVDENSEFSVLTTQILSIEADDIEVDVDYEMALISIEFDGVFAGDEYLSSVDGRFDSQDNSQDNSQEIVAYSGDRYIDVSIDDYSHITVLGRSELNLNAGNYSQDADINISVDMNINGIMLEEADGVLIDLHIEDNSSMIVGAVVSDDIHPNFDGSFDIGAAPEFGNISADYSLKASVISLNDTDYAAIEIDVLDSSELRAYTSYDTNLDNSDPTAGLFTHDVRVRQDSHIVSIDGHFSDITMNVSSESLVEAGSIISIDGWGNDIVITNYASSEIIATDGDVVHIEYYATPDRSNDQDTRREFGNDITITVDDSYISANDDVIDVGAHSTDVNFTATNSAEIYADGNLVKLNGKHQSVDVELTHNSYVEISHDENMIEIIGTNAHVSLDMSYGSEIMMNAVQNLDDRNVIDIQGRFASVFANIGDDSADMLSRGVSLDNSQDSVAISADDFIEIDGGNAVVDVNIRNNSGSLEFTDDFIDVIGDDASVDLSITNSSNICVDDDLVEIEGDFSNVSVEIQNSMLSAESIVQIHGDAYEVKVYVDDSSLDISGDFVEIRAEESDHDIHDGYLSIEIYDSNININDDLLDISGDDNHVNLLVHSSELDFDGGDVFNLMSGDYNTVLATFVSVDFDGVDELLDLSGDNNNINITLSEISNGYEGGDTSFDVTISGDDNHFELNLNDDSFISMDISIDGDGNHISIDLNDESDISVDLHFDASSDNDLDIAINLERESDMDFIFNFGESSDSDSGDINLDLTLNDGSRINGTVYLASGMDLDLTTNAHDHDQNSHIWFSLDSGSEMNVYHVESPRNESMDLRYMGDSADLYLSSADNYDRIDIENSSNFEVWNFGDEDTLMIDGNSFSWHEVSDTTSNEDSSFDTDNEYDHVQIADSSSADTIFLYAVSGDDNWDMDDVESAVSSLFENSGDYRDVYFAVTGDFDSDSVEDDINLYVYDYTNNEFDLSTTFYDASQYFDDVSDKINLVVTGYLNDYTNNIIL